MDILQKIRRLRVPKSFQPVSFQMHCTIGRILEDDGVDIDNTDTRELNMLDSEQIEFLP